METIIYIGGFELPDHNAAAQRVRNNASILRQLGYRVILVGVSRSRRYDKQVYPADAGDSDVDAWEVGYPTSACDWFDMIRADWSVRKLTEQGTIDPKQVAAIICYNYPALAQIKLTQLARSWGAAALADCTEWYATRSWTSPANFVKNFDVALRMNFVNRKMDGVITISSYLTQHYGGAGQPIVEIPTLIEDTRVTYAAILPSDGPLPLFAVASGFGEGTVSGDVHDRIDWILDLLDTVRDDVPPFVLRIAGVDQVRYLSVFPEHAGLLKRLDHRVVFLGRIPRDTLLGWLQGAAFAFVLRSETRVTLAGFPSKYSEAIYNGTPVIINHIPSVEPYHREGWTGNKIDTNVKEDAAYELCRILRQDRQEIVAMKRYCRESRIFSAENFSEALRSFLEKAAKRTRT